MAFDKQISINPISQDIEHQFDPKTGIHCFTMHRNGLFYQQVLSSETFVAMTPSATADYFYVMRKNFDKFLYGQNDKKPSWMGANHNHFIEDEAYTPEWKSYVKKAKSKEEDVSSLAWHLPGMAEKISCPDESCVNHEMTLYYMIIHLNDTLRWKREDIADWLETLDIDLSFKPPTEKEVEVI